MEELLNGLQARFFRPVDYGIVVMLFPAIVLWLAGLALRLGHGLKRVGKKVELPLVFNLDIDDFPQLPVIDTVERECSS